MNNSESKIVGRRLLTNSSLDTAAKAAGLVDYLRTECPEIADRLRVATLFPLQIRVYGRSVQSK
jgi:hypothetical protein